MKKRILASIVFGIIGTSLSASYLNKNEVDKISNLSLFKESGINIHNVFDADSLYVILVKNGAGVETLYLTKDKKFLISGNAIDMEKREKLTAPLENIEIAKNKESFVFGKGKEEYYLFTDPECPYCKEFEKYLPQIEDKVKIKIYHLPLVEIHPDAKEISKYQMQLSKKNKNIIEVLSKNAESEDFKNRKYDRKTEEELNKKINEQIEIAQKLGIESTPTLVTPEGIIVNWGRFLESNGVKIQR